MIVGLHHTAIATRDIDRLSEFYRAAFGLETLLDSGWSDAPELDTIVGLRNSAARFMLLHARTQILELFEFSSPPGKPGEPDRPVNDCGITHICFAVQGIEAEYDRLSQFGMRFHAPPMNAGDWPQRAVYGRDPDGNVVELLEILGETAFDFKPRGVSWRSET